nr:Hint domain-containing protein [Ruegeria arenilitoris]
MLALFGRYEGATKGSRHVLKVVSLPDSSVQSVSIQRAVSQRAVSARRGGFVHGTKIATPEGWKSVEHMAPGDLVRTLNDGVREIRRISTDTVAIPSGETRAECLPVHVPSQAVGNKRPVWLLPEQGVAMKLKKLDSSMSGLSIVPARLLGGKGELRSHAPATMFEVTTLFFDQAEVIIIEGGLLAYCTACRFRRQAAVGQPTYEVLGDDAAAEYIEAMARNGNFSAITDPSVAPPKVIHKNSVSPMRPTLGVRRSGRPGRPSATVLVMRARQQN